MQQDTGIEHRNDKHARSQIGRYLRSDAKQNEHQSVDCTDECSHAPLCCHTPRGIRIRLHTPECRQHTIKGDSVADRKTCAQRIDQNTEYGS